MAEHNPTTTFLNPTLTKDWAPHRCGAQAAAGDWAVNTLSHLGGGGGFRMTTPATYVGPDTARTWGVWEGIAAAGWGYGTDNWDLSASFANWAKAPAATRAFAGLGLRRVATPGYDTPEGRIFVFCGYEYTGFHGANWSISFFIFEPYSTVEGGRTYVARVDSGGNPTDGDFRLVRSGTDILAYYDVGAGWVLLGTYDTTSWTGVGDMTFFQPMLGGSSFGGSGLDNASSLDFKGFTHAAGIVIPPADEGIDDDFEDGVVLPPTYYGLSANAQGPAGVYNFSESGGKCNLYNSGASSACFRPKNRTIYQGDFDVEVDIEVITGNNDTAYPAIFFADVHSDDRARFIAIFIYRSGGVYRAGMYYNLGAGNVTVGTTIIGVARTVLRLTRVGNVYTVYWDRTTMIASWTDTNHEFTYAPLTPALYAYLVFSGGTEAANWYDLQLNAGDDLLLVTPAIANTEFEDPAPGQGEAVSWAQDDTGPSVLAPFMGSVVPIEQFEQECCFGNHLSMSAFEDSDVIAAT